MKQSWYLLNRKRKKNKCSGCLRKPDCSLTCDQQEVDNIWFQSLCQEKDEANYNNFFKQEVDNTVQTFSEVKTFNDSDKLTEILVQIK